MVEAPISISDNLARVQDQIAEAAVRAGRRPDEITLVGVSKTRPPELIVDGIRAGLRHLGENRVQEAAQKLPVVRELLAADPALSPETSLAFHMIGHLQTNKAGSAVGLFDRVDSVDSVRVAQALSRRLNGAEDLPVLIEVYVGDDPDRPGARPDALEDIVGEILELPSLAVQGLMTVAPLGGDARAAFNWVRELKERLAESYPRIHFGVLSMGMSEDFPLAIEAGSTQVRVGTALFGPRMVR